MRITVRVFGALKALSGADALELELPAAATVSEALSRLSWIDDDSALVVAVNREYSDRSRQLTAGDELALIPPVSGGCDQPDPASPQRASPTVLVQITPNPIDQAQLTAAVVDVRAGAVVTFMGITREVPALEYEAYAEMAGDEITAVAKAAQSRHGLCRVAVTHRYGTVKLSEASVVVAVSAPHRDAAFSGAREVIDELKLRAPIWKREEGRWLPGHLPSQRS